MRSVFLRQNSDVLKLIWQLLGSVLVNLWKLGLFIIGFDLINNLNYGLRQYHNSITWYFNLYSFLFPLTSYSWKPVLQLHVYAGQDISVFCLLSYTFSGVPAIVEYIFSLLDHLSLRNAEMTSKEWNRAVKQSTAWKKLLKRLVT